ncbi:hypothetical protein HZH68_006601 [Vespula germanica]|uniref:Uncharacterized protein n=1 Tax=Vespula germanica TaxID=30212 RepID=A0A834KBV2_VESGE|nr:hypothetical protein HZH68_006601 [Vespula germanica]
MKAALPEHRRSEDVHDSSWLCPMPIYILQGTTRSNFNVSSNSSRNRDEEDDEEEEEEDEDEDEEEEEEEDEEDEEEEVEEEKKEEEKEKEEEEEEEEEVEEEVEEEEEEEESAVDRDLAREAIVASAWDRPMKRYREISMGVAPRALRRVWVRAGTRDTGGGSRDGPFGGGSSRTRSRASERVV